MTSLTFNLISSNLARAGALVLALLLAGDAVAQGLNPGQHQTNDVSPIDLTGSLSYRLAIRDYDFGAADLPTLHSFAAAHYDGKWVVLAGRTNGVHGIDLSGEASFPAATQNRDVWVIDPIAKQSWRRSLGSPTGPAVDPQSGLTPNQIASLTPTNNQFTQVGDRLYMTGGYGLNTVNDFTTFNVLTAIDLPGLVDWVQTGSGQAVDHIRQLDSATASVTGGAMYEMGGRMHIVFGQDFEGPYSAFASGTYTRQVRSFDIVDDGTNLAIANVTTTPIVSAYRRRDLNVAPVVRPDGVGGTVEGLVAYSGVFTSGFGAWAVPVEISATGLPTMDSPAAPDTFKQGFNGYHSAKLGMYSSSTGAMHQVMFGGISLQYLDPTTNTVVTDNDLPFVNDVTSVMIDAAGNYTQHHHGFFPEILSPTGAPWRFGANAEFFPHAGLASFENGVIDMDQLTPGQSLGFIFGGIATNGPHTRGFPNVTSVGSYRVFEVIYSPVPEPSSFALATLAAIPGFRRRRDRSRESNRASAAIDPITETAPRQPERVMPPLFRYAAISIALVAVLLTAAKPAAAAYTVQRVVAGLNQPIAMTQAPNDNGSLYIVERADSTTSLGRIRRFDLQTQTLTTFVDISGSLSADGGLLNMAFHPDYGTNGKFYITKNVSGLTNQLEEWQVVGGTPTFQRRLLEYNRLQNNFHTVNQPSFRPGGNNNELFVTTGDGGTQADSDQFNPALIENPNSIYGKLLKIDLTASFPTPANDATHAGVDVVAMGFRNPYRATFDRQTGAMYVADVGFNTAEEVNYIPASQFTTPAPPILDFGWTSREGTIETNEPGVGGPGSPGDINPIFEYAHSGQPFPGHTSQLSGGSITGGYLYRGPVPELQGRYFFSDFTNGNVYSGVFNPATPVASYNGNNIGTVTNHTTNWETLVGGGANIQYVTSFGEDNAGNLYVVKFGNAFFPPLGEGEIFRITPVGVSAIVNRSTGAITLTNNSGAPVSFTSLSIASTFGAVEPTLLTPITGNYDSTGTGSVDNNNPWMRTSALSNNSLFSEATTGDAGTLANGQSISLSPGGGWIRSPTEDLVITLLNGASTVAAGVAYTGNGGVSLSRSDLNFSGGVEAGDWAVFSPNAYTSLAGLSKAEAYARGDLDGDLDNDFADFRLFKNDFDAANGVGALAALTGAVPEPAAGVLAIVALTAALATARLKPTQPRHD